ALAMTIARDPVIKRAREWRIWGPVGPRAELDQLRLARTRVVKLAGHVPRRPVEKIKNDAPVRLIAWRLVRQFRRVGWNKGVELAAPHELGLGELRFAHVYVVFAGHVIRVELLAGVGADDSVRCQPARRLVIFHRLLCRSVVDAVRA